MLVGPHALTQVRIDASVAGDYRPVVEFINAIERDKSFFVINGVNLTGQQTGLVNLRIRMTTYLRSPDSGEAEASGKNAGGNADASAGLTFFNVLLLSPSACKSTFSSFIPRLALNLGSISLIAERRSARA